MRKKLCLSICRKFHGYWINLAEIRHDLRAKFDCCKRLLTVIAIHGRRQKLFNEIPFSRKSSRVYRFLRIPYINPYEKILHYKV